MPMKRGDTMAGPYRCDACWKATGVMVYHMRWTYVGEQDLDGKWIDDEFVATRVGILATCPKCHSSRIVGEVRK